MSSSIGKQLRLIMGGKTLSPENAGRFLVTADTPRDPPTVEERAILDDWIRVARIFAEHGAEMVAGDVIISGAPPLESEAWRSCDVSAVIRAAVERTMRLDAEAVVVLREGRLLAVVWSDGSLLAVDEAFLP